MFKLLNNIFKKNLSLLLIYSILIVLSITNNSTHEASTKPDFLILVNKENPLSENYTPNNLVELTTLQKIDFINRLNEPMYINEEVLYYYKLLYNDALSNEIELTIFSAYRSFEKQESLWNKNPDINYLAPPGCSEHQTGLALDISTRNIGLTNNFTNTKEYLFLINNAYKYGFINRYPKGKEIITGYYFEPWHFRYVGIEHSKNIYNRNITLEEYLS